MPIVVPVILMLLLGIPLFGALIFLLKLCIIHVHSMRFPQHKDLDKKSLYIKLLLLILMIAFTTGLLVFDIVVFSFPRVWDMIPVFWRMLVLVFLLAYWGCFAGLIYGLGQAVGISGVPSTRIFREIIQQMSKSIKEKNNKIEKHNHCVE